MPDIPQATGTSKFVAAWNAVVALALDWKKLRVVAPLKLTRVPGAGAVISYESTGGTAAAPVYPTAADVGSGIYKGGLAVPAAGPISTTTNLTSAGGGNDLFIAPTGGAATAIRLYVKDEADLTTTTHNLPLNKFYYAIPSLPATDGTNTYPGYEIISLPIDSMCVTG